MRANFIAVMLACSASSFAIAPGQIDDFQAGTLHAWMGPSQPTNMSTGGPLGQGDRYMRIVSGAYGGISTLEIENRSQWSGNYIGTGVRFIEVDLRNTGADELSIRPMFAGQEGDRFTTTAAAIVPADGVWHHYRFSLGVDDMVGLFNSVSYTSVMSSVARLVFRHDAGAPSYDGESVSGRLDIDNIQALASLPIIPESATFNPGRIFSGQLSDMLYSDDVRFVMAPGPRATTALPPLAVVFETTSDRTSGNTMTITLESQSNLPNLLQYIYVYDYVAQDFLETDAIVMTSADQTRVLTITENVARYIETGTRKMKIKLVYRQTAPSAIYPWTVGIDKCVWRVQ